MGTSKMVVAHVFFLKNEYMFGRRRVVAPSRTVPTLQLFPRGTFLVLLTLILVISCKSSKVSSKCSRGSMTSQQVPLKNNVFGRLTNASGL